MLSPMLIRTGLAVLFVGLAGTHVCAQTTDPAQDQIRSAIMKWTADFNARNSGEICNLFAPDLRYDYQGFPERGYQDVCGLLQRSLSDPSKRYSYSPNIKEIMVSGDLAIVRLTWTLTVKTEGAAGDITSEEPGIDVFRRQADGSWKIIRYVAYGASK